MDTSAMTELIFRFGLGWFESGIVCSSSGDLPAVEASTSGGGGETTSLAPYLLAQNRYVLLSRSVACSGTKVVPFARQNPGRSGSTWVTPSTGRVLSACRRKAAGSGTRNSSISRLP